MRRLKVQLHSLIQMNALTTYSLQMAIVLLGTTFGLRFLALDALIVPITLGAIATALTDFDDRLSLRLRNLFYVLVLFFSVSSILELLYPYKLYFALFLSLSSAAFILMGALGQRYATISFGTILLSIYTMFGLGEYQFWYEQPCYFVIGALWYGLSSIVFFLIRPTLQVQENLSQSLQHIADLLYNKAKLFDPDSQDVEALLYAVSLKNADVIQSFNLTKNSLLTRLKASRANKNSMYWLHLYFVSQDIHEYATANYLHYEHIHQHFSRSDLIFRIQKNMQLQAAACKQLAESILRQQKFTLAQENHIALQQLQTSISDWMQLHPDNIQVKNLALIVNNLLSIHRELQHLHQQQSFSFQRKTKHKDDLTLFDDDMQDWRDLGLRLKPHLGPQSALFRHATRIALIFLLGYALSLLPIAKNGYWILLTSLFVCQMSYFATKSRLKLRTLGTLLGVILGIPILYFVPSVEGQLFLTVIFGVGFFYLRSQKYAIATLMATLMVLLIFNLKGAGYAIILPRIIDTLIGCLIAWLAVIFVWPDWNFRHISATIKKSSHANLAYFSAVLEQYQQGRNNSIQYRTARRWAHNAQIDLSNMISSLSTEPHANPVVVQHAFRYLVYSHSQLSYISALGSHREKTDDPILLDLLEQCQNILNHPEVITKTKIESEIDRILAHIQQINQQSQDEHLHLVFKQISLLLETLPELLHLRQQLLQADLH